MRYLLTLLLTFNFVCGEESARPRTKKQSVEMDTDMGCNALDCMSDEELQDKLLNLLLPSDHGIYRDHFKFEPKPFELDPDYGYGGHRG